MHVVAFYRFTHVANAVQVRSRLHDHFLELGVVGTALVAEEGINATLAHRDRSLLEEAVAAVQEALAGEPIRAKYSTANDNNPVFYRLKVKFRDEIIQFGRPLRSGDQVGTHVDATQWNELISDPDVLTLDVRNDYEVNVGSFTGAVPVGTTRFSEFATRAERILATSGKRTVAMYCTGGIRCEKASRALLELGVATVYQLDGGILGYLETVEPSANQWQGECFVFDQRVALDKDLRQGHYDQCHACRRPLSDADKRSPNYVKSVSCPYCVAETSEQQKQQFAERAKQESLAAQRGERHVGAAQP